MANADSRSDVLVHGCTGSALEVKPKISRRSNVEIGTHAILDPGVFSVVFDPSITFAK